MIALTNVFAYEDGVRNTSRDIYEEYLNHINLSYGSYMTEFGLPFFVIENALETEVGAKNIKYFTSTDKKRLVENIKQMLLNGNPIIMNLCNFPGDGVPAYNKPSDNREGYTIGGGNIGICNDRILFVIVPERDKSKCPPNYKTIDHHYVTITGLIYDEIVDKAFLRISTWGCEYYIDLDDYIDMQSVDTFVNGIILYEG